MLAIYLSNPTSGTPAPLAVQGTPTTVAWNFQVEDNGLAPVLVQVWVQESPVAGEAPLPLGRVTATLDWNSGQLTQVFNPASGAPLNLLPIITQEALPAGVYDVTLTASNFRSPWPNQAIVHFVVTVSPQVTAPTFRGYYRGPILPRDDGYPNTKQWQFDMGQDILVIASSVKMLLLTQRGERLMNPTYGTNIRRKIFDPNTLSLQTDIQNDIVQALAAFEPRATLNSIQLTPIGNTAIAINLSLTAQASKQVFSTNVSYVRS